MMIDSRKIWNFFKVNCSYEGCSESNSSANVCCASGVNLKWHLLWFVHCSLSFSSSWGVAWWALRLALYLVRNGWLIFISVKMHQTVNSYCIFDAWKWNSIEFTACYWLFMVTIRWSYVLSIRLREARDSGGNLYLDDQLRSGGPVTAAHDLNKQRVDNLSRRSTNSSESPSGKVMLLFS